MEFLKIYKRPGCKRSWKFITCFKSNFFEFLLNIKEFWFNNFCVFLMWLLICQTCFVYGNFQPRTLPKKSSLVYTTTLRELIKWTPGEDWIRTWQKIFEIELQKLSNTFSGNNSKHWKIEKFLKYIRRFNIGQKSW